MRRASSLHLIAPYLRAARGRLALLVVLSLLSAVMMISQPLLLREVLHGVEVGGVAPALVVLLVAVVIGGTGTAALQHYTLASTAEGLVLWMREHLLGRILSLPVATIDRIRTGDLLARVTSDTVMVRSVLTSGLFDIISGVVMFIMAVGALLLIDAQLFLVSVAVVAVSGVGLAAFARRLRPVTLQLQERIGALSAATERTLSGIRTIRAAGATQSELERTCTAAAQARDSGLRVAKLQAILQPLSTAAVFGTLMTVIGVGGYRVANGAIPVADLVAFVLLLFMMMAPAMRAITSFATIQSGLGALDRIREVTELAPSADAGPSGGLGAARARPRPAQPGGNGAVGRLLPEPRPGADLIAFESVGFSYEPGAPVLRDVSFEVPGGSLCALVGPSGAGKSTLLALIERFYEPDSGRILFHGHDIGDLDAESVRARLSYVEQGAPLLAGTIRDNLELGGSPRSDAALIDVLRRVNLHDVVLARPDGLDAAVGDAGVLLSGGQRQRLAIARALLRDTEALLLDEPSANLDIDNEIALRDAMKEARTQGKTTIVVAHRLSTILDADHIVYLDQGCVAVRGTHEELVTEDTPYARMARHQLIA